MTPQSAIRRGIAAGSPQYNVKTGVVQYDKRQVMPDGCTRPWKVVNGMTEPEFLNEYHKESIRRDRSEWEEEALHLRVEPRSNRNRVASWARTLGDDSGYDEMHRYDST